MPIQDCTKNGKKGKKWGDSGTCYTGPDAAKRAHKQGVAIELDKKRRGKKSEFAELLKEIDRDTLLEVFTEQKIPISERIVLISEWEQCTR